MAGIDSYIGYNYTVNPSDISFVDQWKGTSPQDQLPTLVGFQEVGVRSAHTKFFSYYDILMKKWMETFQILSADEKDTIPVTNIVYGTPERLFAIDKDQGIGSMTERVTLPAISFRRTSMTRRFDRGPTLRQNRKIIVPTDDTFMNYTEIKSVHHLIDLVYQIDFWAKYQTEIQMLLEQALLPFGPQAYFQLIVPEYDFNEVVMVHLTDMSDNSALEPGDNERIIRHTVGIKIESYIPVSVSKIVRTIKAVNIDWKEVKYLNDPTNNMVAARVNSIPVFGFKQMIASQVWSIVHNLGRIPKLTVVDENNNILNLGTDYTIQTQDVNSLTLYFPVATAGMAVLI